MNPNGAKKKVTKDLLKFIAECIFDGLTDEETGLLAHVSTKTIERLKQGDTEQCLAMKAAVASRKQKYIRIIRDGDQANWQRIAWFLERRYPMQFSRPEVQLTIASSTTNTHQTLVVTAEAANELVSKAKAMDAEVSKLLVSKGKLP